MNIIVSALLATAGAYAAPFQKRGIDQVVSQCNHNFAYVSSLRPVIHRTPTAETKPLRLQVHLRRWPIRLEHRPREQV